MPVNVQAYRRVGINKVLLVLVSTAVVAGVYVGYGTNMNLASFFRVLVLANVFLVGYLVLLRNLIAGIFVYLYSLVFLNYYWRIILPGLWPDLDIPRLMFVFIWLVFLLEVMMSRRRMLPAGAMGIMMLLIMGAVLLSMFVTGKISIRPFLNGFVIPYAMFAICRNVFTGKRDTERFISLLTLPLALYLPVTAIFEHLKMYSLVFPRYIGQTMVGEVELSWGGRAMGAFIQPAVTGMVMSSVFILAMTSLSRMKGGWARLYSFVVVVLTPIGVFFTYTRSAYLGFAAVLLVLVIYSKRLRVTAGVLLVAIGLAMLGNWSTVSSSNREAGGLAVTETAESRLVVAEASMQMFLDNPLLGCGFDQYLDKSLPYVMQIRSTVFGLKGAGGAEATNQHNQFISVLTEIGLVGFVPFVILYVLIFRLLGRAMRVETEEYDRDFVIAVVGVMAAYVSAIMFIEPRWFEFLNTFPMILLGIVSGGYERAVARPSPYALGWQFRQEREYSR